MIIDVTKCTYCVTEDRQWFGPEQGLIFHTTSNYKPTRKDNPKFSRIESFPQRSRKSVFFAGVSSKQNVHEESLLWCYGYSRCFGFRFFSMNQGGYPLLTSIYCSLSSSVLIIFSVQMRITLKQGEWIRFLFCFSGTYLWDFVYWAHHIGFLYIDLCREQSGRFTKTSKKQNSDSDWFHRELNWLMTAVGRVQGVVDVGIFVTNNESVI